MTEDFAVGPGRPPVWNDLVDQFVSPATTPHANIAFALAVCSSYAYGDADTLATIMDRLGLTHNRCRMVSEYVDALFLTSTAYVIQSADGRVAILCYRGTPPTSLITWMTDFQVAPVKIRFGSAAPVGAVHGGLYRNVRSTRFRIAEVLRRAIAGLSILDEDEAPLEDRLQALYVTGHSLGGASAALFAASLVFEPKDYDDIRAYLNAVYTYGAPMVGDPSFAAACQAEDLLRESVFRYVYINDIVPRTPPKLSGPFKHFGHEYRYTANGHWIHPRSDRRQLRGLFQFAGAPISLLAKTVSRLRHIPFHASLSDHFPQNYIDALAPDPLRSEFGD